MDKLPNLQNFSELVKKKFNNNVIIHMIAIINSMTIKERKFPNIINGSRKRRISKGCGLNIQSVNNLLKVFNKTKKMLTKKSDKSNIFSILKNKIINFDKK